MAVAVGVVVVEEEEEEEEEDHGTRCVRYSVGILLVSGSTGLRW